MSVKQAIAGCTRSFLGSLCLLGLVGFLCFQRLPGASSAAAQTNGAFKIRVEVELVTAEVIVLDKKGKPVHNLKQEDFRLYEDGKLQEIASFDEVTEETAPTEGPGKIGLDIPRGKTVLILFNDSTITADHLKTTRDSAETFVKEHMRPSDIFAVAVYDQSLRTLQGFTDDPEKILAAIRMLPVTSSGRRTATMEPLQPEPQVDLRQPSKQVARSGSIPDAFARYQAESFFRALESVSRSVERIRGCKSILLFSEDISLSDESRSLYLKALNSARRANVVFYTIDAKGLETNILGEIPYPLKKTRPQASLRTAFMSSGMFQKRGGETGEGGTDDGAGKGTRGSSGSSGASSRKDAMRNDSLSTNLEFDSTSMRIEKDVLRSFSSETGGFPIYNTGNFDQELSKLDLQLSNYYLLGFQSNNPKRDGSLRKIEVKTDLKDVSLRYRKSYMDRLPLDTLASTREEKSLLQAMESPANARKLPLVFRAIYFYETPRLARILVSSKIGLEKAEFKKRGGQLACDLSVMGVAYAENNAVAARFSETLPVVVGNDKNQSLPGTLAYSNYFKLQPGKYRLKLAVSDGASSLGSMEQSIDIPAPRDGGITASSLVVAEKVAHLPALIQNIEARLLDDSDPLAYSGMQISPGIENKSPVNSPLAVLFKLYNPAGGLDRWKAIVKARLLDEAGKESALPPISLEGKPSQSRGTEAIIACTLRFKDVEPGKYRLIIETTELQSSLTASVQTDLELTKN